MLSACWRFAAVAACLFLGACGGGGGSVASTPPPPPPPPQVAYDSFPLTTSAAFQTTTAYRTIHRNDSGFFSLKGLGVTAPYTGLSISYDATAGSYTVNDGSPVVFASTSRSSNGYFDTYTNGERTLTLFSNVRAGAPQAAAPVKLTYVSFGSYSVDDPVDTGVLGEHDGTYFIFGYPTQTSDMPRTGTATYKTAVFANETGELANDPITSLTGSATFTANFASGTVDTALTLPFAHSGSASSTYNGSGSITDNYFSGQFTTSDDPEFMKGDFAGGFFGPSAQEMGYAFSLQRGGKEIPTFTIGVAVGTKSAN